MINFLARNLTKFFLWLRYDIKLIGIDAIEAKGRKKIVFLPNHPALVDPVILYSHLQGKFAPHGLGDVDQLNRPVFGYCARKMGVRTVPSVVTYGPAAKPEIERVLNETIEGLKKGDNLLLWPSGRLYHTYKESLGANSSVERILKSCPDVRIVLVRTRGLWGSQFSWASGNEPFVGKGISKGLLQLLASGIFFAPRRKVTIEFYEPQDLPRTADRSTFNRYLEDFYNKDAPPNTYVPYSIWEKGGKRVVPEPVLAEMTADYTKVPESTKQVVLKHLSEQAGIKNVKETDKLAGDLGMDSLVRTDLLLWIEKEFGHRQADADAMQTVGDVMLAACGQFAYTMVWGIKPVPAKWFKNRSNFDTFPQGDSVTDVFLKQASLGPSRAVIADQISGCRTYRELIIACLAFKPLIQKMEGDCIGIMLPASVAADIAYLAVLFSGKIPVMVNWTAGQRNIVSSMDSVGVKHILTAKALVDRIAMQGIDLSAVAPRFSFLEELRGQIGKLSKIKALILSYISWVPLRNVKRTDTAAILFTSGSETLPKAVPLSDKNIISNMRSVLQAIVLTDTDRLIGFLPPFHSFGLTVTVLLPLLGGAQVVYSSNPNETDTLAKIIEAYKVTMLVGTPTFLGGIVRVATKKQLESLRFAVTGAEKCPQAVYEALKEKCTRAIILEGYGVTECSPIISLNDEKNPRPFSIGKIIPGLESMLIHPETQQTLKPPATGLLLVSGPSVFNGYLNYSGKSPFIERDGKRWYNTGDLVSVDQDGLMTFQGRLKRFVKLGGEMISLPAIESILETSYPSQPDKGPVVAVEATEAEQPELVLFTTINMEREDANSKIRAAGLSGLHSIRRVIKVDQIPLLGTGKTDYRSLKQLLAKAQ